MSLDIVASAGSQKIPVTRNTNTHRHISQVSVDPGTGQGVKVHSERVRLILASQLVCWGRREADVSPELPLFVTFWTYQAPATVVSWASVY
jgi:hypothetical protein